MKVFLNPGHAPNGEPDPGACNEELGLTEAGIVREIADKVEEYLTNAGVEVVGNFQCDSLDAITSVANSSGADLFVSIHCNSASVAARGTEVCVYPDSEVGHALGNCIQRQIVDSLGTVDRGLKERVPGINGLYVLNNTAMPAVLVETAFISNYDDAVKLRDRTDEFAAAIARGITDYECMTV
ncbi:MAG: N-acetylmuramoyl-L-alanine amidase [Selenomonadaceae bacterium]|nr:N-acetylmuramoyl-L-alanine amidase [Selenomonadaceae bacterium]